MGRRRRVQRVTGEDWACLRHAASPALPAGGWAGRLRIGRRPRRRLGRALPPFLRVPFSRSVIYMRSRFSCLLPLPALLSSRPTTGELLFVLTHKSGGGVRSTPAMDAVTPTHKPAGVSQAFGRPFCSPLRRSVLIFSSSLPSVLHSGAVGAPPYSPSRVACNAAPASCRRSMQRQSDLLSLDRLNSWHSRLLKPCVLTPRPALGPARARLHLQPGPHPLLRGGQVRPLAPRAAAFPGPIVLPWLAVIVAAAAAVLLAGAALGAVHAACQLGLQRQASSVSKQRATMRSERLAASPTPCCGRLGAKTRGR